MSDWIFTKVRKDLPKQLAWIFCGNNDNLPQPYEPVTIIVRQGLNYKTYTGCHWRPPLDPSQEQRVVWYMLDAKVNLPVLAWLYIPDLDILAEDELNELAIRGILCL